MNECSALSRIRSRRSTITSETEKPENRARVPSRCCGAFVQPFLETPRVEATLCRECGTAWVEHLGPRAENADWQQSTVTPAFLAALARRREVQAAELLRRLPKLREPILDYGCGQAAFFEAARKAGFDVWATDVALPEDSFAIGSDHFVEASEPWSVPPGPWGTVVLLDVLEHHPDPASFLESMPTSQLVVKVPLLGGPAGRVAQALARLGRPTQLEGLLLVGFKNPHRVFFTSDGVARVAAPRRLLWQRGLADVGAELPECLRGHEFGPVTPFVRAVGAGLAAISPVWSDTGVFVFDAVPGA